MQDNNIYTTGEFAKRANVSIRTIRYYDDIGLLKPTMIRESGYRCYTDRDFAKLQRIIVLKRLGFSLEDIINISRNDRDTGFIKESFELQLKLIQEKMSELKQIEQSIQEVSTAVLNKPEADWDRMVSLIHLLSMEESLEQQYKSSKNIDARMELHRRFSLNPLSWFCWIYRNLNIKTGMKVLETGCGNGKLWLDNLEQLPEGVHIALSDISSGMLRSAKGRLKGHEDVFTYECFDFHEIPYADESFDLVVANHVLFYAKDREKVILELKRVLKKGGALCCSTYGRQHMKEIELLAKEYDDRIALSEVKLYDIFGLEYGAKELTTFFSSVQMLRYEDSLQITEFQPLADYIYSCHGNQMEYLSGKQEQFEKFLIRKIGKKGLQVTKDAGIFYCIKKEDSAGCFTDHE